MTSRPGQRRADARLDDEEGRLRALQRMSILDTPEERIFETIVALVRQILAVPICAISLVDRDRQWLKAQSGLDVRQTTRDVSFCQHAIRQDGAFVIGDATNDARFAANPLVTGDPGIRSYAGIPLCTGEGYMVGALCAIDTVPRVWTDPEIAILRSFAGLAMHEMQSRHTGMIDHLTGALSRHAWMQQASAEAGRCRHMAQPAMLAMLDIDSFRSLNNLHGHVAGDRVLWHLASVCLASAGRSGLLGRHGGGEFVLLLPEAGTSEALVLADRIRAAFGGAPPWPSRPIACSVSIGLAALDGTGLAAGLDRAARALAAAKADGGNTVVLATCDHYRDEAASPRSSGIAQGSALSPGV